MKADKEVINFINELLDVLEPNGEVYDLEYENILDSIKEIR